ncbi:MAG: sulfatase [Patescibacteria group bacterium]
MRKNTFVLIVVFAVLIALFGIGFFAVIKKKPKPILCADCNVILLSVDSLRADHVGVFGYKRDTTPNFDAFSREGALFLNYFSTSFLTPVSEMSVHTGLYPTSHGVTNFETVLPDNKMTVAEYLKSKNYETSAISSSPEFEINPALKKSFSRGFDKYQYYIDTSNKHRQFFPQEKLSLEFDALAGKKFFLWLAVGGVHWPYGDGFQNVYADKDYNGLFKNRGLDWTTFQDIYKGIDYASGKTLYNYDVQYVIDNYDNGVRAFDDFLGQLIDELKRRNLLEKTIVIIESEHGEGLHEHGYFAHYDVLDTQVHVPLLIFIPSVQTGQKILSFAGSVDVFPTLIELLGGVVPDGMQGKSLAPIMNGTEKDGARREVFIERNPLWEEAALEVMFPLKMRGINVVSGQYKDIAIRTPEWKYILRLSKERVEEISWWKALTGQPINIPEEEMYNLIDDPMETQNVADRYPEERRMLRKKLEKWYEEVSAGSPQKIELIKKIQPYF